jgi:hypothetical protein
MGWNNRWWSSIIKDNERNKISEVRTYYICFDNERTEVKSYGWVDPNQVFETIWIFDEFTDEEQWIAELLVWGIVPDIDEEGNLVL